jgi:hypothetical protein
VLPDGEGSLLPLPLSVFTSLYDSEKYEDALLPVSTGRDSRTPHRIFIPALGIRGIERVETV